jgi:hypothetical protein
VVVALHLFDLKPLIDMATLHQTRLLLQDLSCDLSYATKQDKYLSSDLQKKIDAALQAIAKIHGFSPAFSQLDAGAIREHLIQSMASEVERADQITNVLDLLKPAFLLSPTKFDLVIRDRAHHGASSLPLPCRDPPRLLPCTCRCIASPV